MPQQLAQGWSPPVRAALLDALGRAQPKDFAVFDFDNTCIQHDIGDMFFHECVDQMAYRFEDERFWSLLDPQDEPERLRELARQAQQMPASQRPSSDAYAAYLRHASGLYQAHSARHGHAHAYLWVVRLMVGMTPERVLEISRDAYLRALSSPMNSREVAHALEPGATLRIPQGVRVSQHIEQLFRWLESHGVQVWIVSASAKLWVVPMAQDVFGIPPHRVLGNGLSVQEDGTFAPDTVVPPSFRQGKVAQIRHHIHPTKAPLIAVGDAMTDFEMLSYASGLALVLDHGNEELRGHATRLGWPIEDQTRLSFGVAPQPLR